MSQTQDYATHIVDLLHAFGDCQDRPMFDGFGIFHQGLMFDLIADGSLYLKADEFFENDATCLRWARLAFDAALHSPTKRNNKKS